MDNDSIPAEPQQEASEKLTEIFARVNMSDLPAMSSHVTDLITLTGDKKSSAQELANIILKDYSLTNKVLQVVNSAFYSLARTVTSISRAITILGFDAIRDLAIPIALFEDFLKSGVEKTGISKLLAKSFLSGLQARDLSEKKSLKVIPEEAFICSLLHSLGKIIACLYFPDMFREIEAKVQKGISEEDASLEVLEGLTYSQLGMEIAKFWNLSEKIVASMEIVPEEPESAFDELGQLKNLSYFTNQLVDLVCHEKEIHHLLKTYSEMFSIDIDEVVVMMNWSVENAENISRTVSFGLNKLKVRSKIVLLELTSKNYKYIPQKEDAPKDSLPETVQPDEPETVLPNEDFANKFIHEMTEKLVESFQVNDFYKELLGGICKAGGFDRAILAFVKAQSTKVVLTGRMGHGEIDKQGIKAFEHKLYSSFMLANPKLVIPRSLKLCKDMAIPANTKDVFPEGLQELVKDRTVYLLPICLNKKPIGLLYLDQKDASRKLSDQQLKSVRLMRDLAVMAVRKMRDKA